MWYSIHIECALRCVRKCSEMLIPLGSHSIVLGVVTLPLYPLVSYFCIRAIVIAIEATMSCPTASSSIESWKHSKAGTLSTSGQQFRSPLYRRIGCSWPTLETPHVCTATSYIYIIYILHACLLPDTSHVNI